MKYLESKGKEVSVDNVNSNIRKLANKMWDFYGNFI
jgi:hypothetical protein